MPSPPNRTTRLLRSQLGLARALWWAVRRRSDVGPADVAVPYNGPDRVLLCTLTVLAVLETAIVHVLVSWPVLRWALFVVSVYGVLGLIAFDGTLRQHPHLLRAGELALRFGHFRSVEVPLDRLTSVRQHVQHKETVEFDGAGRLAVSFMGGTNVELSFDPATEVDVDGRTHAVTRVAFSAHDPRRRWRCSERGCPARTGDRG
jgi:hypothetical protein